MALIKKPLTITINGNKASLNEEMYFYEGDRNIDFEFTITDSKYKFNEYNGNILVNSTAKYAVIKVLKPNGEPFMTDKINVVDNTVVLSITSEFADVCDECGTHKMQIHLFDVTAENDITQAGRITIPEITFEVYEPIFHDDGSTTASEISVVSCKRVDI